MSPQNFEKCKGRFDPTPQKEEVPLAMQLAKKTKERGSVLAQIERERALVGDLKPKYERHMERKYSLQREIEELEALSTAAEAQQGIHVDLLPQASASCPQDDEAMESGALAPSGVGVGFMKPTKTEDCQDICYQACVWRKGAFAKGRRSSLIVKAESFSTDELVRFQEDLASLSNSRQSEDKSEVQVVAEQETDDISVELEPSASLG